mgnify:CR=1 FL=1
MKVHEYQAKAILASFGVATPSGKVATTPEEAREIAGAAPPDGQARQSALQVGCPRQQFEHAVAQRRVRDEELHAIQTLLDQCDIGRGSGE